MSQPTDRLGQPLAVGDWVVFHSCINPLDEDNGRALRIKCFDHADDDGEFCAWFYETSGGAKFDSLTKINPKPQTTTWDKCVFVPEGVNAD